MPTCEVGSSRLAIMSHVAALISSLLLTLAACAAPTAEPPTAAPPVDTVAALPATAPPTATTMPTATHDSPSITPATSTLPATPLSPLATPIILSADGCPAPAETYRNEVMGIELPVPDGLQVREPQYLTGDYGVVLAGQDGLVPFQAIWLYQQTPEQLEALVAEQLAQLADLPTERAPVVVGGIEGAMLSPVPGEVAQTAVYLPVDGRLFLLLYANGMLDDTGRCWLAGLRFFLPTRTLQDLDLLGTETPASVATTNLTPASPCPPSLETYRSEAMGLALAVPAGHRVFKPAFSGDEYTLNLVNIAERSAVFQATWLHQTTPEQLGMVIEEEIRRWHDVPLQRIPITVAGIEGLMLTRTPGEVANAPIFLAVENRVYRLLYSAKTLDDLGRCLLAGMTFFTPTLTLDEQFLTQEAEVQVMTRAAVTPTSEIYSGWAVYHNDAYGFSFSYPDGRWTVIERANDPHALSLAYHELGIALRLRVARAGEAADLQLYGGAAGEFVPLDEVMFVGQPVSRAALVYEDIVRAVHYNDTTPIARGDLLFSLALVSNRNYAQGAVVPDEVQAEASRILETLALDEP